jgi:hypothetical protein
LALLLVGLTIEAYLFVDGKAWGVIGAVVELSGFFVTLRGGLIPKKRTAHDLALA